MADGGEARPAAGEDPETIQRGARRWHLKRIVAHPARGAAVPVCCSTATRTPDIARVSPLAHAHVIPSGTYRFPVRARHGAHPNG
jgi:hypothetical protein